jgi:hypothetical protein
VEYPAGIFAAVGEVEKGVGQRFESDDGHAVLSVYARENEDGDTPTSYLRKNLRQPARDYERVTRSFFAISMERDGTIYYSRCNLSHSAGGSIHCFDLVYPQAEKRAWDPVVTRISLSLRPLEMKPSSMPSVGTELNDPGAGTLPAAFGRDQKIGSVRAL